MPLMTRSNVPLDQFEVLNELVRRGRHATLLNALFGLVALCALAVAFMAYARPLPVVVRGDDPRAPASLAFASTDGAVREIDAKRFFVQMAERLHGWNSANVVDELTSASFLMTTKWRQRFASEVNSSVEVPLDVDASGRATQLVAYAAAKLRNDLDVDWDSLKCAKAQAIWHCKAKAQMRIQPLTGAPVDDPRLSKSLQIKASFIEVPAHDPYDRRPPRRLLGRARARVRREHR